ncbi:MAG: hypothetical protein WCR72_18610, partial [Bacteroidota bacterium]
PAQQYVSPYMAMGNDPANRVDPNGMYDNGPDDPSIFSQQRNPFFGRYGKQNGYYYSLNIQDINTYDGFQFLSGNSSSKSGGSGSHGRGGGGGGGGVGGGSPEIIEKIQYKGNYSNAPLEKLNTKQNPSLNPYTVVRNGSGFSLGNGYDSGLKIGRDKVPSLIGGGSDFDNWGNNFWTAATLTANWLVGGNQNFTFNNNPTANAMRNSPGIVKARNDYYKTGKTSGWYNFGLKGLMNAGMDPIEQFVGSYNYTISIVGNNLQFTLINTTSFSSAAYHLWPSSWNWTNGPMGSTTQTYIFTEPLLQIKK